MSATKKQTAVEWLVAELIKLGYLHSGNYGNSPKVLNALEQAKQMEKEQIMDAYNQGSYDMADKVYNPEQYYNETYD